MRTCSLAHVPTCEHGGVGTVQDDELCHHLGVVNGEQPRHGPAPVVAHQAASVVPLEEKQIKMVRRFSQQTAAQ